MPKLVTLLRVFLASPSDLNAERIIVREVVQRLNGALSDSDVRLELLSWETHSYPHLGSDPQNIINEQIGNDYEIFIGLMWTRFGTPTPRAGSGTEEEFNRALAKAASTDVRILFYFKGAPPPSLDAIEPKQLEQVRAFKKNIQTKGIFWTFDDPTKFGEQVFDHLLKHTNNFRKTWGFNANGNALTTDSGSLGFSNPSAEVGNAQSRRKQADGISVVPSKRVYARLNFSSEWKKEFTARFPVIEGIDSESILHKINDALSYENVFDFKIKEAIDGYDWIEELDYRVNFIKRPFLNLTLMIAGCGAYPSRVTQSVVVNSETGERLMASDLFEDSSLTRLASIVNEFVQADLKTILLKERYGCKEISLDVDFADDANDWPPKMFGGSGFGVGDLNHFLLDESGISFIYDFGFPHAMQALVPEGRYYFGYSSLKRFIKKGGVLDNFYSPPLLPNYSSSDS